MNSLPRGQSEIIFGNAVTLIETRQGVFPLLGANVFPRKALKSAGLWSQNNSKISIILLIIILNYTTAPFTHNTTHNISNIQFNVILENLRDSVHASSLYDKWKIC